MTETIWIHRTMVVTAAIAPNVRALADSFGPAAGNMWTTALSATGTGEATHYISSGLIDQPFADMMTTPEALQTGCAALGIMVDLPACQYLLSQSDVSEDGPFEAMARLGLQMLKGTL